MKLYEFPTKDLQTALKVIQAVQANRQERENNKPKLRATPFKTVVADKIRSAMKAQGLSFGKLAKKCGITKSVAYNMVWNLESGKTVSPAALERITNVLFREPKKSPKPKKADKPSVTAKFAELNDRLTSFGEMLTGGPSELTQMSDSIRKTLEECEYDLIAAMEILSATYRPAEVWAVIVTEKLLKREKVQPMIISALRQARGHITEAAKKIGMHRPVMVNLITEWKLTGYCTPGGIDRGAK